MVLRKINGAKRQDITCDWIKLRNVEFCIKEVKSSRMKWADIVA
jgi:hypothetical protein